MNESLRLTDDEAAALAAERSVAWPSELPSVDVEDVGGLTAAVTRGRRSLYARRLVDLVRLGDEEVRVQVDAGLAEVADLIAGAGTWIRLYLADDTLLRSSYELLSYYYPLPDGAWLVETVDEGGVRTLSRVADDGVAELLLTLAELVRESGVPGSTPGGSVTTLCIAAGSPERASVLAVTRGMARLLDIVPGSAHVERDVAAVDLADALGVLRAEATGVSAPPLAR